MTHQINGFLYVGIVWKRIKPNNPHYRYGGTWKK